MSTEITPRPTAPLPQSAADALHRLADAGLPVGPSVMAAEYRKAEARANKLIADGRTGHMSDLDADDLAHYIDLMAGARATLTKAGRLDLIGGAS